MSASGFDLKCIELWAVFFCGGPSLNEFAAHWFKDANFEKSDAGEMRTQLWWVGQQTGVMGEGALGPPKRVKDERPWKLTLFGQ